MSKFIAGGCSFTFGHELSDDEQGKIPSKKSWAASDQVQLKFAPQVVTNGNGNGNGHEKGILNARKCPECNTPVIFEEGCMKCVACGWNKCE